MEIPSIFVFPQLTDNLVSMNWTWIYSRARNGGGGGELLFTQLWRGKLFCSNINHQLIGTFPSFFENFKIILAAKRKRFAETSTISHFPDLVTNITIISGGSLPPPSQRPPRLWWPGEGRWQGGYVLPFSTPLVPLHLAFPCPGSLTSLLPRSCKILDMIQERQCGIQQNARGLQSVCSNTR